MSKESDYFRIFHLNCIGEAEIQANSNVEILFILQIQEALHVDSHKKGKI